MNGDRHGPFIYNWFNKDANGKIIDPKIEAFIKLIKFNKTNWLSFSNGKVYFIFICSFGKEGITKAMYGINKDIPDTDYSAHLNFDTAVF